MVKRTRSFVEPAPGPRLQHRRRHGHSLPPLRRRRLRQLFAAGVERVDHRDDLPRAQARDNRLLYGVGLERRELAILLHGEALDHSFVVAGKRLRRRGGAAEEEQQKRERVTQDAFRLRLGWGRLAKGYQKRKGPASAGPFLDSVLVD